MIHQRWPLHPTPVEGEALSSWLGRVASVYKFSLDELLRYDLGYDVSTYDLDLNPPVMLLENIERRSNVSLDQIHHMTFRSWVPFIIDNLEADSNVFETYMLPVLLPFKSHPSFALTNWRPWISSVPSLRACQTCIKSESDVILRLAWKLPVMISCPLHECRLQPCISPSSGYLYWQEEKLMDWPVTKAILTMDTRTWQALTTGKVDLPGRSLHAGVWFRLLRTLLNELTLPLSRSSNKYSAIISRIWDTCGHPVRSGLNMWKPYEHLPLQKQMQILEAAATAMTMIEEGLLIYPGISKLFQPELIDEEDLPSYPKQTYTKRNLCELSLGELVEQIVVEAKKSRQSAETLRSFCLWGKKNDLESIKKIDALFLELGIPFEFS